MRLWRPFLTLCLFLLQAAARPSPALASAVDGPPPPVPPEVVSRDSEGRVTLRAVPVPQALRVDGALEEPIYRSVPSISDFIQQEPREGEPATEKTEVWFLFDQKNIYISARCWDSHPERMVANEMRRDHFNLFQNENFAVILDTFYDRRNGFLFNINPLGGFFDGYITDERDNNRDWNTVWEAKTGRFGQGWTVEMAIPFKSLRYKRGSSQIWGVNFRRVVRWKNEISYLTHIPASFSMRGITKVSAAATVVGIEPPSGSKNLELKPYATSGVITDREADPPVANDLTGKAGFDVKYGLTRSLTFDFTYNTDFAQVEEDEQQVNLTRFDLFFPEKREFFLEGQGIFAFGGSGQDRRGFGPPSDAPVVFFSRRIGLHEQEEEGEQELVPIEAGGRLTGKLGKYSVGVLNIQTRDSAAAGAVATNFSVFRLKRDVLRRSSLGLIATRRGPSAESGGSNRVFGLDANFAFFQNLALNGYYARSKTPGLSSDEASYLGRLEYSGDRYGIEAERLMVGESFNPEIGFLRREDFLRHFAKFRFSPRPRSIPSIRKFSYETSFNYITDGRGRLETREAQLSFRIDFENGDDLNAEYSRNYEFLKEGFELLEGVVIPVGGYSFQDWRVSYRLGPQRNISGWFSFQKGSFYSGHRTEAGYWGRVELSRLFSIEPRISINCVNLAEGRFTTSLVGGRATYTLTPRAFLGALVQYNSADHAFSSNLRFRWEYQPGSDLFVVFSEGRDTLSPGFPSLENRSLVVKLTRLFRF